jgi:transcription elongation factor GreA
MAEKTKQQYTKSGYQELVTELERRKTQDREKIREDIAIAKGFGDLSENAEYDAARTAQAENEARINELENLIENAIVVDESSLETGIISLGSVVILHDMEDDEDITYSIVGSNEVDPLENRISDLSPIGHAIMGKRAGDEVQVEVPNGSILHFRVVDVTRRSHD